MCAGYAVQYEEIIKFSSILRPLSCLIDLRRREDRARNEENKVVTDSSGSTEEI